MTNSLAHIEINVSNIEVSKAFYMKILEPLGWKYFGTDDESVARFEAPDKTSLFLVQTESNFIENGYHRKNTGLNHLAFRVGTHKEVDSYSEFLDTNTISKLYHNNPKNYSSEYAMEEYYAVFFEDPDRIKLEVVFMK